VVAVALALAPACSHQQKVETTPGPVARSAPPAPRRVAVAPPTPDVPEVAKPKEDDAVFFDFDSALVRDDARPILQKVASMLRKAKESLNIEGNCDELGTTEYNLALGEQRAAAAKRYLVSHGIEASRIQIITYGLERPLVKEDNESAWAVNRNDQFVVIAGELKERTGTE
jgi:peptidoglycan-associated lipoprotein